MPLAKSSSAEDETWSEFPMMLNSKSRFDDSKSIVSRRVCSIGTGWVISWENEILGLVSEHMIMILSPGFLPPTEEFNKKVKQRKKKMFVSFFKDGYEKDSSLVCLN